MGGVLEGLHFHLKHYIVGVIFPFISPKLALGTSQSLDSQPKPYHISRPQPNRK